VHAIERAMVVGAADGHAFLVGDREQVTWRELYAPIAVALGFRIGEVPTVEPVFRASAREWVENLRERKHVQRLLSKLPRRIRWSLVAGIRSFLGAGNLVSPWQEPEQPAPEPTIEMSLLYSATYRPPSTKAEQLLGYQPPVAFDEACRRTVGWLEFAGYPVVRSQGSLLREGVPAPPASTGA
jgi:2-alkyl-3-oxoalkanoate reductase